MTSLLTVDEHYDRDQASDGISRYGFYLKDYRDRFIYGAAPTNDPARFALTALVLALPATMSPGYVRAHPRVCAVNWHTDGMGASAVEVELVAHMPPALTAVTARWNGWRREGVGGGWHEPADNRDPSAFLKLTARFPVDADFELPPPSYRQTLLGPVPVTAAAKASIRQLVRRVNICAQPLLEALES